MSASKESFDQSIKDLLELSRKILNHNNETNDIFATKKERKKVVKNPIIKCLDNYKADYDLSEDAENKEDVIFTYKKVKAGLLKGPKFDDWLKSGEVNIFSGSIEPDMKRRLMLSGIYNTACRIRDQTKATLHGLPVEAFDLKEELLYPDRFMLYMYRVFLFSLSGQEFGDDITKLGSYVADMEKELKISPASAVDDKKDDPLSAVMGGFAGIAKDLIGKMGGELPEGANIPTDGNSLLKIASEALQKPEMREIFNDFTESLRGTNDIGEVMGKVFSKFQDPRAQEKLKKAASALLPTEEKI